MQKIRTKLFEQKNEIESIKIEKIMRKKNVRQDKQLQEFITKIIDLKNKSESHTIEKFMKTKNVSQDNQL